MAVNLSPIGGAGAQFFDNYGNPLTGGFIYTYAAGTSTPLATYTAFNGLTQNANPIQLNSAGRPPAEIWLTNGFAYKFVITDANAVLIGTYDNIVGFGGSGQGYSVATQGQTVFTVPFSYVVGQNNVKVFVNGSKQIVGVNYNETNATSVTFVTGLNLGDVVEFAQ